MMHCMQVASLPQQPDSHLPQHMPLHPATQHHQDTQEPVAEHRPSCISHHPETTAAVFSGNSRQPNRRWQRQPALAATGATEDACTQVPSDPRSTLCHVGAALCLTPGGTYTVTGVCDSRGCARAPHTTAVTQHPHGKAEWSPHTLTPETHT